MTTHDMRATAEMIGSSYEWLRKQVAAGLVECTRLGRLVRFTDGQVQKILADRVQPVAPRLSPQTPRPSPPPPQPPSPPRPVSPPRTRALRRVA